MFYAQKSWNVCVNMGAWTLRFHVLIRIEREAPCVCSGAASIVGLPYEVWLCLNMVSLSMKCEVTVALHVLPLFCVSRDRQLHIHRHSWNALHVWPCTQRWSCGTSTFPRRFLTQRISYREIFSSIFLYFCERLLCFETLNFGVTCCVRPEIRGQRVHPERWYSTIWTKARHISEHPKLSVFRICVFFLCIYSFLSIWRMFSFIFLFWVVI